MLHHTDHHPALFVTQRDGFLAAVLRVREGSRIGLEDIEIDRQIREMRITGQTLQQGLTLRQYLLRQRPLQIERCLDEFGYHCHGFSPPSFLKSNPMSGPRAADLAPLLCTSARWTKWTLENPNRSRVWWTYK